MCFGMQLKICMNNYLHLDRQLYMFKVFPHIMSFHFSPKVFSSLINTLLIHSWVTSRVIMAENKEKISSKFSYIFKTPTESMPRTKGVAKMCRRLFLSWVSFFSPPLLSDLLLSQPPHLPKFLFLDHPNSPTTTTFMGLTKSSQTSSAKEWTEL